jgi:predicted metal-dependent hydrolase
MFCLFLKSATLGKLRAMFFFRKRAPEKLLIAAAGRKIPVVIKRNPRARRLILRVDEALGLPVLTLPKRTALSQGEAFLRTHIGWVEAQLRRLSPASPFAHGTVFPLRGTPCRIEARGGRGLVTLSRDGDGFRLSVPGDEEFVARRVTEWLKREARRDLEQAVARHAAALGRSPKSVRVGDPKSRWGSCSSTRVLTFSWRLVLAPPKILNYLVAHEVAHLREMNHGKRFWALVERLDADYEAGREWLAKSGVSLAAVGRGR